MKTQLMGVIYQSQEVIFMAMAIDRARELLQLQVKFEGYYNRNSTRMILADVQREPEYLPLMP